MPPASGENLRLVQIGVILALVHDDRLVGKGDRLIEHARGEVRHPDVPCKPASFRIVEGADRLRKRYGLVRPMNEQQIELIEAELPEAPLRRAWKRAVGAVLPPDFGGDPYVISRNTTGPQTFADLCLVLVHGSRIDVAVPARERRRYSTDAFVALEGPCAVADYGNRCAGGRDARTRSHLKAVPYTPMRGALDRFEAGGQCQTGMLAPAGAPGIGQKKGTQVGALR